MRINALVPVAVSGCLLLCAANAGADRVAPAGATTNMGSGFGTSLVNTINGAGLSAPTLVAKHDGTIPPNSWVSAPGVLTGLVTFDLGGPHTLAGFSFW